MDKDIVKVLEEIGLSGKEAEVYMALLKLGEASASRISEIAQLNRITTYVLLKSLGEKGFCSVYVRNNIQYFKPTKPEGIIGLLEERKDKIKSIMPLLKEEEKLIEGKPEVSMFEGKRGISSMLDTLLRDAESERIVRVYGNYSIAEKVVEYQSLSWRKRRVAGKIQIRAIVDEIPEELQEMKGWKELSKVRRNKKLAKLGSYVMITKNYVAYLVFRGELSGILIKDKEIVNKELFNFGRL